MGVIQWYNNLTGGSNQSTTSLVADNETQISVNTTQDDIGSIAHRLGAKLFLDSVHASNPVRGSKMFQKNDGTKYLHMIASGNLYVNGVSTWTTQESSVWNAASEINMANFIGKQFFASSNSTENIRYGTETGSTSLLTLFSTTVSASSTGSTLVASTSVFNSGMVGMTVTNTTDGATRTITAYTSATTVTVNSAINDTWDGDSIVMYIAAKYLAVNGAYMVLANNPVYPRRTYWTGTDTDTINVGADYFVTSYPPVGVSSFGNGRAFIIFTNDNYLVGDPATLYTNQVDGFGCVSHRSIQTIRGSVIWADNDAIYMLSANSSYPTDISESIKNDLTGNAIMNQIAVGNLSVLASGVYDSKYYLALRDLSGTVKGKTLNDCVIVIDTLRGNWNIYTYEVGGIGSVFAEFTDSNGTNLYAGSYDNGTMYRLEYPDVYVDDDRTGADNNVTATIRTKNFVFMDSKTGEVLKKNVKKIHFKYRAAGTIDVDYALDAYNGTFTDAGVDLPATDSDYDWEINYIDFGVECHSFCLELSTTGDFALYAIGIEVESTEAEGITGL